MPDPDRGDKKMNTNRFQSLSVKGIALLFATLFVIATGLLGSTPIFAEPQMTVIETPLEGTSVLSIRVNPAGKGHIVLRCSRCTNERIRLKVTPAAYATVDGRKLPLDQFTPGSDDFITGLYRADTNELTRLIVTR